MRARRAGATLADQAFSSASNFVVGLFVARLSGPRAFGAFALATVCWLLVAGIHRALVAEPLAIGAAREPGAISRGLSGELVLGAVATVAVAGVGLLVLALGGGVVGVGLLALAPWLVVLVVQDYWRWVAFARGRPQAALVNDIVFTSVQLALLLGLATAGHRGVAVSLAAWGTGAAAGAVLGFAQFRVRPRVRGGAAFLRASWPTSRWLLADFAGSYGSTQLTLLVLTGLLGPAGIGAMRAGQNLMGPANVLLLGGTSFGLPESSRALERDGRAGLDRVVRGVSLATGAGIAAYGAVVVVFAPALMRFVYGEAFAGFGLLAQLAALQLALRGFAWGPSVGLKAARRTRALFGMRVLGTAASLVLGVPLALAAGVEGAAWAAVLANGVYLVGVWVVYRRPNTSVVTPAAPALAAAGSAP